MAQNTSVFSLLVDLLHEQLHPVRLAFLDLDDLVEVVFRVKLPGLDLALDHRIIGRIDILVEGRGDLLHLERRQEAIVDAFLERVDVDRLAEIGVGVHVVLALWRGGQAELHGRGEVFEDAAPVAFVVCAAAMALVNDDEIEEVRRILAEIGRACPSLGGPLMKVWKIVKNRLPFFGTLPFLRMSAGAIRTIASSGNAEKAL